MNTQEMIRDIVVTVAIATIIIVFLLATVGGFPWQDRNPNEEMYQTCIRNCCAGLGACDKGCFPECRLLNVGSTNSTQEAGKK
jgi:hypothetical protein